MAEISSILSILVNADTSNATSKLTQFDRQFEATRSRTREALRAQLGGEFNPEAFSRYDARLTQTQRKIADRAKFKAALGGDFNPAAFNAYERSLAHASTQARKTEAVHTRLRFSFGALRETVSGLTGSLIAMGAAFASFEGVKESVKQTVELGHATERLTAVTGLDTKTASTWIESMKTRGVRTTQVNMAFITLSRNIRTAQDAEQKHGAAIDQLTAKQDLQLKSAKAAGDSGKRIAAIHAQQALSMEALVGKSDKATAAFHELGVSQAQLVKLSPQQAILAVADGLSKVESPARRAALAQQLFGRGAQALLPVLVDGRRGVQGMLDTTQKYGAYLPNHINTIGKAVEAQRAMTLAMDGIRITIAAKLMPVLLPLVQGFLNFVVQMREGKGAGGQFASALVSAFHVIKSAATEVLDAFGGIKGTIEAIAVGYGASKLLHIAGAFRELGGGLRAVSGSGVVGATAGAASSEVAAAGGVGGVRGVAGRLSMGLGRVLGATGWLALAAPLGIALTSVVGKWISGNANREGDEWASRFTQHLGGHISKQVRDGLAKATNTAIQTPRPGSQQAQAEAGNTHLILNPGQRANPALFNQAFNKQFDQLYTAVKMAGQKAGETFIAAWGSVKFPTEPLLLASVDRALNSVPERITRQGPQWVQLWKDQAAQQMLQYATKLNQEGKLPLSAVQNLMRRLEGQIPGFSAYLQSQGLASDQAFARALKFTQATAALKQTLLGYRKDFNDTSISINLTGGNINSNVARAMKHLKSIISTSTGDARAAAVHDFNRLKDQTTSTFSAMADRVSQTSRDMSGSIQQGSKRARTVAVDNFARFQAAVYNAMSSGSLSTSTGMSLITRSLNATLKALGVKQIPVTTIDPHLPKSAIQKSVGGAARGGLFQIGRPGEAGRDSVPLNVGGMPIMVAPGEQVAVFNRHQLPVVNRALAPMGGLPGLFSKVSRPNYMAGGGMVPGFAGGGSIPYGAIEGYWDQAGGPRNLAAVMAAIAEAESAGIPGNVQKGQPYGTTGWGLWQITPGNSEPQFGVDQALLNPLRNAMAAVAKYRSQGLAAWTTYTSGAYKRYLNGNVPAAGALAQIAAPAVKGGGTIGHIAEAAVQLGAKAATAFLSRVTPTGGGTSNAGGFSGLPRGLGSFDGLPVADWIIPILQWASSHGWHGRITSGYRTFQQQANLSSSMKAAAGHSNHELANYPGGAIDVGSPSDRADGQALWNVLRNYPGRPDLVWGGPTIGDWGHFSATGHARGGLIGKIPRFAGAFAAGGAVTATGPTLALFGEKGPETATFVPGYAKGGTVGASLSIPLPSPSITAASNVSKAIGEPKLPAMPRLPDTTSIPSMIAWAGRAQGTITTLRSKISSDEHDYSTLDQFYNLAGSPDLVDPNTGELNEPAIKKRLGQLDTLIAYRRKIFRTWSHVVAWTEALVAQNQRIVAALHQKLGSTREILARLRSAAKSISTKGLKGKALGAAHQRQRDTQAAITKYAGIQSATISDIAKYSGNLSSAQGDLISGSDDRDSAWLSLLTDRATRASVAATKAQPIVDAGSSATSSSVDTSAVGAGASDQTAQLLQTLLTQSQQTTAVSQAQYQVLSSLPPFGGSFADGGMVPGPAGMPRTIIAHGGEMVSNSTAAPEVHLHFADGMGWLRDFVRVEINQSGRGDSRYAVRALPGARGR